MIALGRTLWVAVVVGASSAGVAGAQDAVDVAKAKAEGKVVWYTSTPIEQGQKIADAFQKETGIKVEMFRSGGSSILRRFQVTRFHPQHPHPWHSCAGGGAVHSIRSGHSWGTPGWSGTAKPRQGVARVDVIYSNSGVGLYGSFH